MNNSTTHYDTWFTKLLAKDSTALQATVAVIHRYLDGKPASFWSSTERDAEFWTSSFWTNCPDEVFQTEGFALALAKYLGRDGEHTFVELRRALSVGSDACKRGIRYSKVFLVPKSARWQGLQCLLERDVKGYRGFVRECRALSSRYAGFSQDVDDAYRRLSDFPLLDLIVLASVSAFKTELPPWLGLAPPNSLIPHPEFRYPLFNEAVSRLLARRISDCTDDELVVTEEHIRRAFIRHMYPLLREHYADGGTCSQNLDAFERYIDAQLRLDGFRQKEVSAFCFDTVGDSRQGHGAGDLDPTIRPLACFEPWVRANIREMVLRKHWTSVGLAHCEQQALARGETVRNDGTHAPLARTFADLAILHDLFGVEDKIDLGKGISVDLAHACMFLELARDNYRNSLLIPFAQAMQRHGNWAAALCEVIEAGMVGGLQQRYPILFATVAEKLQLLRQFTITEGHPSGSDEAAAALMEFWGNDLATAGDPLHRRSRQLKGNFAEQPLVRLGEYVFTLPWVLTTQDTPTSLINNLRRVRAKRPNAKRETHTIERRLEEQMQRRGFRTFLGFEPEDGDGEPPGEIDLIAELDGHLFVFEIKSGYVRQNFEAAWHHRTSTLRKAGRQLLRKVDALRLSFPEELSVRLGLNAVPADDLIHSWIVDTSIDFDREKFSGHLKVSMTEVIVALKDNAQALCEGGDSLDTLYPVGFSAAAFAEAIEEERIWNLFGSAINQCEVV